MSKRLIDCNLFSDDWVHSLSKDAKLFFIYYTISCDHAGILKLNKSLCEFQTGIKDFERVIKELGNSLVTVKEGMYFMPRFIKFQYPGFPRSNVKQQESALKILSLNGITKDTLNSYLTLSKELPNSYDNDNDNDNTIKERYENFIKLFNKITGKSFKGDDKSRSKLNVRLKEGYTPDQIRTAIEKCFIDPYHKENPKFLTPEFILRPDKLQMWLNSTPKVNINIKEQPKAGYVGKDGSVWDGIQNFSDFLNTHS